MVETKFQTEEEEVTSVVQPDQEDVSPDENVALSDKEEEEPEEKMPEEEQTQIMKEVANMEEGALKIFRTLGLPKYVYKKDQKIALETILKESKYISIYFSASWCSPCKKLLPHLIDVYQTINTTMLAEENKDRSSTDPQAFEIILMPCDNNRAQYEEFYHGMPFCTVDYKGISFHRSLCSGHHEIETIPTLVIYDTEGNLMTKDGVEAISLDKTLEQFPWKDWKTPLFETIKQFIVSKLPLFMMVAFMVWRNYSGRQPSSASTTTTTTTVMQVFEDEL